MTQLQQHLRSDTIPGRQGIVVRRFRPLNQSFVITGGKKESTRFAILKLIEQHIGQGESEFQITISPATLQ